MRNEEHNFMNILQNLISDGEDNMHIIVQWIEE